jgi:hypothetical protein
LPAEVISTFHDTRLVYEHPYSSQLLGYWPLNEGAGTTAFDRSKGLHNGEFYGGISWVAGVALNPVRTLEPTDIQPQSATLNSVVKRLNSATTAWFEWETTDLLNTTGPQELGNGSGPVPFSTILNGLLPNTSYQYRLVATNELGTFVGGPVSFETAGRPGVFAAVEYHFRHKHQRNFGQR